MSIEPERPIEKALRHCARERRQRAGSGWKLHGATRRLLQAEVRQQFGRRDKAAVRSWEWRLRLSWARLVGGMGVLAAVFLGFWLLKPASTPEDQGVLLARNEIKPAAASAPRADREAKAVRLSEAESAGAARTSVDNSPRGLSERTPVRKETLADKDPAAVLSPLAKKGEAVPPQPPSMNQPLPSTIVASAPVPAAPAEAASEAEALRRYGFAQGGASATASPALARENLALTSPGAVPAGNEQTQLGTVAALTTAAATLTKTAQAGTDQAGAPGAQLVQYGYFVGNQVVGRPNRAFQTTTQRSLSDGKNLAAEKAAALPILNYFRVEQQGAELRVIDSDGSVYSGPLEPATGQKVLVSSDELSSKAQDARTKPKADVRDSVSQAQEQAGMNFRVLGTNQRSNQRVVFAGTLTGLTNAQNGLAQNQAQAATGVRLQNQAPSTALRQQNALPSESLRMSGKVVIGQGQEVEVDAVSAPVQAVPK